MSRGNLREVNLAIPPQVLQLKVGDTCRVRANFDYVGPAISATLYIAIGNYGWAGFDEIIHKSNTISLPDTYPKKTYESYVDIYISSAISPGRYDLYAKLIGIPGPDIFSSFYENLIEIVGVPPAPPASDLYAPYLRISRGTYDLGEVVTFDFTVQYQGKAQSGWMTISLGTGVVGTFFTKHTFARKSISFRESLDWTPHSLSGHFILPSALERGQTYSTRAKVVTADGKQETATEYGVITIAKVVIGYYLKIAVSPTGAGSVTKSPYKSTYAYGEVVGLTARAASGYRFNYWDVDGELLGYNSSINFAVFADHTVTAHFVRI